MANTKGLRVAVEGCAHGELQKIYSTLKHLEQKSGRAIDLLICCGDFQAMRNLDDLECLACPPKYRQIGSFYKYYSGEQVAPYPTLFIGGNHEASNYLWELYYGGWVAPRIYYLGHAGVIRFGGLRIGGMSGIFNSRHYRQGHFEKPPYTMQSMRSAYHVRELEVHRLSRIQQPLDVFLSHDWPRGIAHHGATAELLRKKPFFREEVEQGTLGSPPAEALLHKLQPRFWFSAHLHVKFAALVKHSSKTQAAPSHETAFLALDKCLPGRGFLQVLDFPEAEGEKAFHFDREWLAILRATHSLLSLHLQPAPLPGPTRTAPSQDCRVVDEVLDGRGGSRIPENFARTAPAFDPRGAKQRGRMPQSAARNPQTLEFLNMLRLPYNLDIVPGSQGPAAALVSPNPEEIDLDASDADEERVASAQALNPEEIDIDGTGSDLLEDDPPETTINEDVSKSRKLEVTEANNAHGSTEGKATASLQESQMHEASSGDALFQHNELHNYSTAMPDADIHDSDSRNGEGHIAALASIVPQGPAERN